MMPSAAPPVDEGAGAPAASGEHAAGPPKVDPETLVLRGTPRRAVRFRREFVIGLAAASALGIAGAAWIALEPASFRFAVEGNDEPVRRADAAPDVLAGAPGSYDAVPLLGPPLPGDLGRPILAHRRTRDDDASLADTGAADAAAARREAEEAGRVAALQSPVMLELGTRRAGAMSQPPGANPAGVPASVPGGGRDETAPFARAPAADDVNAHRIVPPASPWLLSGGSIIAASLVTAINSDTPGLVVAQVTENCYDSLTGRTLLIPQGARLVGRYESGIGFGQRRAMVVWQRIIWPDGASLRIDNVPAADAGGMAGLADRVDFHGWALAKGVAISTLLGVGTELGFGARESELVRAMREAAQTSAARAGDRIVDKALDISPTVRVRSGWPVRVIVHKDLVLKPWRP